MFLFGIFVVIADDYFFVILGSNRVTGLQACWSEGRVDARAAEVAREWRAKVIAAEEKHKATYMNT